ncbi:MAG: hypothetical protein A2Y38_25330 [Spirochaetes bacterium GWB1_59_5]|nr:MAG: hypothetical protein A2Y38_25330 [Spirochaetes bacterium GWB1_59_5]
MVAYRQDRINNAICYFAAEHRRRAQKPAYQTYIYKYLAIFDFRILQDTGRPALDIGYDAYEKGPVPRHLYDTRATHRNRCYKLVPEGENSIIIEPSKRPNLEFFSAYEIEVMNELLERFAHPWITTDDLIEATHDITAWKRAWTSRGDRDKVPMSYEDNFEGLTEKTQENLSPAEESFIVHKSLKELSA